jgi:putative endonuclease
MYVYMLTNKKQGTLYIGVTNNIERRMAEHESGLISGFTQKYNLKKLVWVEQHQSIVEALRREKQLKNWHRAWKIALIEQTNPDWRDLSEEIPAPSC